MAADRLKEVVDNHSFADGRDDRQQVCEQSNAVELRVRGQVSCGGRRVAGHQNLRADERLGEHASEDHDQIERARHASQSFWGRDSHL